MSKPFIAADARVAELSFRSVILAIILAALLATSNAFLALKLGILTSASIPAAILSMGILRFFKNATLLENNAVQTAASAGEAVAGGIVYTIPALIIIQYWHGFDYLTNFFIAVSGGILGVLFSIPLRRVLVHEPMLKFPEGRAIAEVLKSSAEKVGIADIVWGGVIGSVLELFQVGFKVIASHWNHWFVMRGALFGFGAGFSPTMIGAGYLVGFDMALSIFLGAVISWWFALPAVSCFYPEWLQGQPLTEAANALWDSKMRYLGIGAMLFAGIWTFGTLVKPLGKSMRSSLSFAAFSKTRPSIPVLRTEKDIPLPMILFGVLVMAVLLFLFFQHAFPLEQVGFVGHDAPAVVLGVVLYVLVIGFLFSVITAYFSGMVGVTASPGSSVVIAGLLLAAWLLLSVIATLVPLPLTPAQLKAAEAITIVIGSVVTGIAAIANDNTQDLKVGQLVGATPWKQQVMLLLGVLVSSLIIPPVMQLLFDVYGIAGVMPHAGMDSSLSLPAPTAALLAAVTEAAFLHALPWGMMFIGAGIILSVQLLYRLFRLHRFMGLSLLGVAIGMYLPITSSVPLFLGGMMAKCVDWRWARKDTSLHQQIGTLIACGLVAGSALMDVLLAIPFSLSKSPNVLQLVGEHWYGYGLMLALVSTVFLAIWMVRRIGGNPN